MRFMYFSVGNIPYEATEEKLKDIFNEVGPVISFKYIKQFFCFFFKSTYLPVFYINYFIVDWFMTEKPVSLKVTGFANTKTRRPLLAPCAI